MAFIRNAGVLKSTAGLLAWDQQAIMPPGGLVHRSQQLAQLARMIHEMMIDPRVGDLLSACEADGDWADDPCAAASVNIREIRWKYERATRLPAELVESLSETSALAHGRWVEARKANDFEHFCPWFEKIVQLQKRKAECLGSGDGEPWDVLADEYEPGCRAADIDRLFASLRKQLIPLVNELMASAHHPGNVLCQLVRPGAKFKQFVRKLAADVGFDFDRGRLDESPHPFCSGIHCHDVRMTTRFDEPNPVEPLFSTLHETGHGIYGQNLPESHFGTPMGEAVSYAIHESQSRMWENMVGRSRSFWVWCLPRLCQGLGIGGDKLDVDGAYGSANIVTPGLIRVEADEVTYNLHIMVRFEIERALMKDEIQVRDVPCIWAEKYKEYLGVDVPDDRHGCLQDIHWSSDAIGYFPSYTLGNLYAAQFFDAAQEALPGLVQLFENGEFSPLREWLNKHIHCHGMRYRSDELCQRVTGRPLSAEPLLGHLVDKLRPIYGL